MRLSDLPIISDDLRILVDGDFTSLGLLVTKSDEKILSFIEDEKYLTLLANNNSISCMITSEELVGRLREVATDIGVLIAPNPREAFFKIHEYLLKETDFYFSLVPTHILSNSYIHPSADISSYNVQIGENCRIEQNVVIKRNVYIGNNVYIGPGTIIGGDGFECFRSNDRIINVEHAGGVIIKNNVNIHANVCIDKGLFKNFTLIEEFCSIDNLVHIAHNVQIGKRTRIAANAVVSGRTVVGHDVWIGPSVTISNGIEIGDGSSLTMGSIITKSVPPGKTVMWKLSF